MPLGLKLKYLGILLITVITMKLYSIPPSRCLGHPQLPNPFLANFGLLRPRMMTI